jgi:hypothetical protein
MVQLIFNAIVGLIILNFKKNINKQRERYHGRESEGVREIDKKGQSVNQ